MYDWARATVLNWRWWVVLPCLVALLPILALQLAMYCVISACATTRDGLESLAQAIYAAPHRWWKRNLPRKPHPTLIPRSKEPK